MDGIEKLGQGVGKSMDKVPNIYDDGLKLATKESGKVLALIPQTINAALAPLRQWIAQKEYTVAVPAIQAIAYSVNYLAPKGTRLVTRSYGPGVTTV